METPDLPTLQAIVTGAFPEIAGASFSLLTEGWDSVAVDAAGRWIFKFPRHAEAERRLRLEASVLAIVRPAVAMRVPDLTLIESPRLFSRHAKLPGEHLLAAQYDALPTGARDRLATAMAELYASLHGLDRATMRAAGARPINPYAPPDRVSQGIACVLPPTLRGFADRTLDAWTKLPPDPLGETYGYFDGHGWNMAFDHAAQRLNGVYDFADSGFGPLHNEFVPSGFIARDLTWRIIEAYEAITGRQIDRNRVDTTTAYLRLVELAGVANDPERLPAITGHLERWASGL